MPTIRIPLGPGSDPARAKSVGEPELINCYAEVSTQGKAPFALYTDPGLVDLATLALLKPTRGVFALGSKKYAVAGESLYLVATSGAVSNLGTILGAASVITAANKKSSGAQIAIVADARVYVLATDILTLLSDPDLPANVHSVAFMDGYLILGINDGRFFWTALNEATDIDALDFAEAEGSPDNGVRVLVNGREFLYFGEASIEIFINGGDVDLPFVRAGGGFISSGCLSKYTPAPFDNSVAWVDEKGRAMRLEAYQPKRFSNHAVEADIKRTMDAQRANEIEAFVFSDGGHEFYQLSGPDWTWKYDAATKQWTRKKSYGLDRSRIRHYVRSGSDHVVGDLLDGKLYTMSDEAFDEAGGYLVTSIISPIISEAGAGLIFDSVLIDAELGVGRRNGDSHDAEPMLRLRWSDDGMKSWSNWRERSLGAVGKYTGRLQFNDLGACGTQGRAFEVSISAPVARAVISASAVVRYAAPGL